MRITESQLRRIIREGLIGEAPLDDIIAYDVNQRQKSERTPSIAHPRSRSRYKRASGRGYMDIARDLMRSTKDNWVIITPSDTGKSALTVKSDGFKEWLAEKRKQHPAGTIFAFSSLSPFGGDFKTPEWSVIHDLLGHSVEASAEGPDGARMRMTPPELLLALHGSLPRELQVSRNKGDLLPDILAAILLGRLSLDTAHKISEDFVAGLWPAELRSGPNFERSRREHAERVDYMFAAVDEFVEDARSAGFVELIPW